MVALHQILTQGNIVHAVVTNLNPVDSKLCLSWKILVILLNSKIRDKDLMSGGFRAEVSLLVLMLYHHKKSGFSPKLHPSSGVLVGRVCEPITRTVSATLTNLIGSGNRRDLFRLNVLSLTFKVQ